MIRNRLLYNGITTSQEKVTNNSTRITGAICRMQKNIFLNSGAILNIHAPGTIRNRRLYNGHYHNGITSECD